MPLAALTQVAEEGGADDSTTVSPWDSISNTGTPEPADARPGGEVPGRRRNSALAVRLKAAGDTDASGGVKIVRPPTLQALHEAAASHLARLWPGAAAGAAVGAVEDFEGCEVRDDNYELVDDGAV
eukprot:1358493-Prymnesium_polylepis.1